MRRIAMLLALVLMASGCTMIMENDSLRRENERLRREVTAEKMRADEAQRDLAYARKYPETLHRVAPSAAAKSAPKSAASARPANAGTGQTHIVIGEADVTAEAKATAQEELVRLNAMIASVKADYDAVGGDSDRYTTSYNELTDTVERDRRSLPLFDQVVTPALDSMPPAPDPAAQARYDAARADEARRAEEAKQADEEAAQKREAAKEAQANREATAKVAADAAVKAMEKNAPPPVMVVPGVVRTPVATPAPNGPPGAKMQ